MAVYKVFVSYHHAIDQANRNAFESLFAKTFAVFISKSVQIGEISPWLATDTIRAKIRDEYLRDSTASVVLIGIETWQRRHVDWEISSSLRQTKSSSRSGVLGIILPTHPSYYTPTVDPGIIPPRLVDNQVCGHAMIYKWSTDPAQVAVWIEAAYQRRSTVEPDNSYPHFVNNKTGKRWR